MHTRFSSTGLFRDISTELSLLLLATSTLVIGTIAMYVYAAMQ